MIAIPSTKMSINELRKLGFRDSRRIHGTEHTEIRCYNCTPSIAGIDGTPLHAITCTRKLLASPRKPVAKAMAEILSKNQTEAPVKNTEIPTIEKGIPIPSAFGRDTGLAGVLHKMEDGDSILLENKQATYAMTVINRKDGYKAVTRVVSKSHKRVWAVKGEKRNYFRPKKIDNKIEIKLKNA